MQPNADDQASNIGPPKQPFAAGGEAIGSSRREADIRALAANQKSDVCGSHTPSEIGLTESDHSLVHTWRIENREVKLDRLTDPSPQVGVIAQVIERQWVNQNAEPRAGQFCFHKRKQPLVKVNFELRRDMRSRFVIPQFSDK